MNQFKYKCGRQIFLSALAYTPAVMVVEIAEVAATVVATRAAMRIPTVAVRLVASGASIATVGVLLASQSS